MKVIVTTSDKYLHLLPIFCYLFNKFWSKDQEVEIVGYKRPPHTLPSNFKFHSLGVQTNSAKDFSNDLRPYFEQQDEYFIWMAEDAFLRAPVDLKVLELAKQWAPHFHSGRFGLSTLDAARYDLMYSMIESYSVYALTEFAPYRISMQPSIWNKYFLLKYLRPNLSPWGFEKQPSERDIYDVISFSKLDSPIIHNEGVRVSDIHKYDLNGIAPSIIAELKKLQII